MSSDVATVAGPPGGPAPRTLVTGAGVRRLDPRTPDDDADAVIIEGDRITWIGRRRSAPQTDRRMTFDGWLSPAFVDAHVHGTGTGLSADGVSLAGCASLHEAMTRLRTYAEGSTLDPILGGQWDESGWREDRPPHADELAAAAPGRTVLLERVDSHSIVVDAGTLARASRELPGWPDLVARGHVDVDADDRPTGWLKERAAEATRQWVLGRLAPERLNGARHAACQRALTLGIASFHEMGHPGVSGIADATAWAEGEWPVDVQVWWADLDVAACPPGMHPGGDLFLDGSIGSSTAAVTARYRDGHGHGTLFHPDDEVAGFFVDASRSARGAGVHVIGDRAIEQGLQAVEEAARVVGRRQVRGCRHRFEHVELPRPEHVHRMAALGIVASVQPMFDAAWGGSYGLYARRFGAQAALSSNPLDWFAGAGVVLAFGSDSTVTPMNPWSAVLAAERHLGGHGVSRPVAWSSHTLGGRYVARQDRVGPVRVDHRADLVVWDRDPLAGDDPTGTTCLATFVRGAPAYVAEGENSARNS